MLGFKAQKIYLTKSQKKSSPSKDSDTYKHTRDPQNTKQNIPENKILLPHNYQNTKCTLKRKHIISGKGKCQVTYNSKPIRITTDFSADIIKDRRTGEDVLQTLGDQRSQFRQIYPTKLSITIDRENKIFYHKTNVNTTYPQIYPYRRSQKENSNP